MFILRSCQCVSQSNTASRPKVALADGDGGKRVGFQRQPLVVSAFLPRQTGWLQLGPGESALVTPKI